MNEWRVVRFAAHGEVGFRIEWVSERNEKYDVTLTAWAREDLKQQLQQMLAAFDKPDMYWEPAQIRECKPTRDGGES